jgi:hypothetical protein
LQIISSCVTIAVLSWTAAEPSRFSISARSRSARLRRP